ncbi:RagB/SusD family nutrient uptake outer membrane protein [Segetibacter aerophilus]|uniref:Starch-binding protein n=1 Tax=Segetibacter aerophilus TaxID=670293 RepID=A0A512BDW5_9BACT|nr:RagB/SusD family nutrient uptake outer membrane protein [Segetibacter aerophilus]GEO10150.1 starch-binding protein [Segetibacter aerophilus]
MKSKYLNKFNKITASFCLILVLGSCKKYLDQQPITDVGPETVFSDVNTTYQAIIGVYSRLVGDAGYGIRLSLYYPLDNDEMQGPTGNDDNDRRDIARFKPSPSNAQLSGPFNQIFQGIAYANTCIDRIPKMAMYTGGTEQQKKQLQRMLGEALTLRAQYYFEAIRNWGDLPIHFLPSYEQASEDPLPVRVNRDTLYAQIIEDLRVASDLVPWRNDLASIGDAPNERITKGAVKGLRARIALYRGGYSLRQPGGMQRNADYLKFYQIARDEANDIMTSGQHTLNPSFRALWKDQVGARVSADPNGELMFQASGIGQGGAEDTKLGYYNGPRVNNLGNSSVNPLPTYLYLFDSTDTRRDVTIAPYNVAADGQTKIGQAITAMNDGKYRRDWISNPAIEPVNQVQYFSLKWQILRYSDVLLMFAEAENELNGPTAAAYNAINMVRRRGFGKPLTTADATVDLPAGLSKAQFFAALVRERSLELGGEGVRKYDLIRWNLISTAITETKANLLKMSTGTGTISYSYMANPPQYAANISNLPTAMYYKRTSTADNASIWSNSYYTKAPTATPSGTTSVVWVTAAINTVANARFATGFTPNKSELLPIPQAARDANPNLTQNPGY